MGSERPAIDWGVLDASTAGDSELAGELLSLFVELALTTMDELLAPDRSAADAVHKIRGAASAIGAQGVADAASRAEAALRRIPPNREEGARDCGLLRAALDRSVLAIKAGRTR